VAKHLVQAFAVLGMPKEIKRDNGPASTSTQLANFCQQWAILHTTGIQHSPTSQGIVERAHRD
ncbi:POK18 protein, partial [Orthonyx spaldingii]|nr:POK18 protein [Orthonyx spaldingii]